MRVTGIKREKMCRTFGQKMMLKAERCASPKCAFTRRQSKPGLHGAKRRRRGKSEYGMQLVEKQRIRLVYGISERSLRRFVREASDRARTSFVVRNALDTIAEKLELRLDNVVFRAGFAPSRAVARQFVSHGHILVNGCRTTVPSWIVRVGDAVSVRQESMKLVPFLELAQTLRTHRVPAWLTVDPTTLSGKVVAPPLREEAMATLDLAKVVEFYAR